mmetsp:Transcript_35767/g.93821  ORF Transcript_35767/g.93821 Transcript_35767/m.93821 type:complete len:209 (+) Transcript_35767:402-1028(+)
MVHIHAHLTIRFKVVSGPGMFHKSSLVQIQLRKLHCDWPRSLKFRRKWCGGIEVEKRRINAATCQVGDDSRPGYANSKLLMSFGKLRMFAHSGWRSTNTDLIVLLYTAKKVGGHARRVSMCCCRTSLQCRKKLRRSCLTGSLKKFSETHLLRNDYSVGVFHPRGYSMGVSPARRRATKMLHVVRNQFCPSALVSGVAARLVCCCWCSS